jgi:hypothetical protein
VTGGITFDNGADYWNWIVVLVLKTTKEKIEEEVYKTPIEKATNLLNTLEQKGFGKKGRSLLQ